VPQRFNPEHMSRLLSPERRRRQPPERLLAALGVGPGTRMADIGCGPGFYALPAARSVGASGRVYALDVEPAMVERVREDAAREGLTNVEARVSGECSLPLPDGAVDLALMANVLHECADRSAFLREARRILAPGGGIAVVEWRKEPMEMGPPLEERMTREEVCQALADAGFGEAVDLEPDATGATHFGVRAPRA
jgi:ubiquinone/menaquinone biosynthesis C-methylase UbiE